MPNALQFRLTTTAGAARRGEYTVGGRSVQTPAFMPVATQATVKTLTAADLTALGAQQIVCNTYHLWQRPGEELIKRAGGLHRFMGLPDDGPAILTDSGGFQVFSLSGRKGIGVKLPTETDGEKEENWPKLDGKNAVPAGSSKTEKPLLRRLDEDGAVFASPIDGKLYHLTPEVSMRVQHDLGTDIVMALDECTPYPATVEETRRSMELTHRWEQRSMDEHRRLNGERGTSRAFFAIAQGGMYPELRAESVQALTELNADGYALGGLSVGEPKQLYQEVLEAAASLLPKDKPRYVMGVGTPVDLVHAAGQGIDLFDCVLPTRNARNGQLFTWAGRLNLRNARFRDDFTPPDHECDCPVCRTYTRAYLAHLTRAGEFLGLRLASYHNLHFYLELMRRIRRAIEEDTLPSLQQQIYTAYNSFPE